MAVNDKQKRYLRGLAHSLKPVVMVGNKALTENVINEVNIALERHELIKVRVSGAEKEQQKAMLDDIAKQTNAEIVLTIGHIGGLYRPSKEVKIQLPR
jgi:RNA-binding protein